MHYLISIAALLAAVGSGTIPDDPDFAYTPLVSQESTSQMVVGFLQVGSQTVQNVNFEICNIEAVVLMLPQDIFYGLFVAQALPSFLKFDAKSKNWMCPPRTDCSLYPVFQLEIGGEITRLIPEEYIDGNSGAVMIEPHAGKDARVLLCKGFFANGRFEYKTDGSGKRMGFKAGPLVEKVAVKAADSSHENVDDESVEANKRESWLSHYCSSARELCSNFRKNPAQASRDFFDKRALKRHGVRVSKTQNVWIQLEGVNRPDSLMTPNTMPQAVWFGKDVSPIDTRDTFKILKQVYSLTVRGMVSFVHDGKVYSFEDDVLYGEDSDRKGSFSISPASGFAKKYKTFVLSGNIRDDGSLPLEQIGTASSYIWTITKPFSFFRDKYHLAKITPTGKKLNQWRVSAFVTIGTRVGTTSTELVLDSSIKPVAVGGDSTSTMEPIITIPASMYSKFTDIFEKVHRVSDVADILARTIFDDFPTITISVSSYTFDVTPYMYLEDAGKGLRRVRIASGDKDCIRISYAVMAQHSIFFDAAKGLLGFKSRDAWFE